MRKRFYIGHPYKIKMKISLESVQDLIMISGISIEQICNKYNVDISDTLVSENDFTTFKVLRGAPDSFRQLSKIMPFKMTRV